MFVEIHQMFQTCEYQQMHSSISHDSRKKIKNSWMRIAMGKMHHVNNWTNAILWKLLSFTKQEFHLSLLNSIDIFQLHLFMSLVPHHTQILLYRHLTASILNMVCVNSRNLLNQKAFPQRCKIPASTCHKKKSKKGMQQQKKDAALLHSNHLK